MKKTYETPVIEKLEFDYSKVVTASDTIHGDYGNGRGCGRDVTYNGRGCGSNND